MDQPPIPVSFKKKGTIYVEAPVVVRDEDGNIVPIPTFKQPGVVKFCGCGKSANKPFCDGSHKRGDG
ncbi:MAG TPA: CDGSH iron-sulfur domain-containing protein [Gemmatimonadales bacterium]|nr:CDGSH iron-sulfur domain-containing protein [Gemmatimonadales bacterium]